MQGNLLRLYPPPGEQRPLEGAYLSHDLPARWRGSGAVYTNFISSLDGHISELAPGSGRRRVPSAIANPRDWRLYMELAAQADAFLTTARHLRAVADGRHTDLIGLDDYPDLIAWRQSRGLPRQPALAAVSESLDIPVDQVRSAYSGPLIALVSAAAPASKVRRLEERGMEVLRTGEGPALDGAALYQALRAHGWQRIYSIAGPRVAHALIQAGVLNRLYLTIATLALGGREFDALTRGDALEPPGRFTLAELYLDTAAPAGASQLFAVFDKPD